jgi:hypothetical protein
VKSFEKNIPLKLKCLNTWWIFFLNERWMNLKLHDE